MLSYLLQGAQIGFGLSLLVGPLVVLLIQLSLEEGTLSSLLAALGIWVSDFMFIYFTHHGMSYLRELLRFAHFELLVGSIGGLILLSIGLGMWIRKAPEFSAKNERKKARYTLSFAKGFAINTFNPFPVFFWPTVTVGIVHEGRLLEQEAMLLYLGIMGIIIFTDILKVIGARYLRHRLRPQHIKLAQRAGAMALMLFGVALVVRVWW